MMFHIKGHRPMRGHKVGRRKSLPAPGRPGRRLHWVKRVKMHAPPGFRRPSLRATPGDTLAGPAASQDSVPDASRSENNGILSLRGGEPGTSRLKVRRFDECKQLAILGLLDPEMGRSGDPYGLASFSPDQAPGAVALQGLPTDNLRSITRLSPRDSLAAFGLLSEPDFG